MKRRNQIVAAALALVCIAGTAMGATWEVKGDKGKKYRYALPDSVEARFWTPAYTAEQEAVFFDKEDTRLLDSSDGIDYVMTTILQYNRGKVKEQIQVFSYDFKNKKHAVVSTVDLPLFFDGKKGFKGKEWHGYAVIPKDGNPFFAVSEKIYKQGIKNSEDKDKQPKLIVMDKMADTVLVSPYKMMMKNKNDKDWTLLGKDGDSTVYVETESVHFAVGEDPSQIEGRLLYENKNGYVIKTQTYTKMMNTGELRWSVVDHLVATYDKKGNLLSFKEMALVPEFPKLAPKGSTIEEMGQKLKGMAKPPLAVPDPLTEWNKKEEKKKAATKAKAKKKEKMVQKELKKNDTTKKNEVVQKDEKKK